MRPNTLTRASVALAAGAALVLAASPAEAEPARAPSPAPAAPATLAAQSADRLVASSAAKVKLRRGKDTLKRTGVLKGTRGLQYVTYDRTYQGLSVVGGDVVVTTDATGAVKDTAVAQSATIDVPTTATVTAAAAVQTARKQVAKVEKATAAKLTVLAWGTPKLAYEVTVEGKTAAGKPSGRRVFVDARTGKVLEKVELYRAGTGTGNHYGAVSIDTTLTGSTYYLRDPNRLGLYCGNQTAAAFSGPDDVWGTGSGTDLETACVDALWGAQREIDMLSSWFGRNGIKGNGLNPPMFVGLDDENAYYYNSGTTDFVNFGHNLARNRQVTSIDVVAHELGHAVFRYTPGGSGATAENGGINEATGDIFGALTEAYANSPLDPPDYQVGEKVDLVGDGPIRYMYNPQLVGDPNCWSTSLPDEEHMAAGPLNHWFYLLAEGSNPVNGQPVSPTCNGSRVTGLSIRTAGEIYYNALQAKTSTWKYANVRTATLAAARNLYPASCTQFNAVKAAWAAVNVPAQSGEATCTENDFSVSLSPAQGTVTAGSSVTTTVSTAVVTGAAQPVALTASGLPDGVTASFDPATVSSGGSSVLTLSVAASTLNGSYAVTVTATGTVARTATYRLTVTGGAVPSCSAISEEDVPIPDGGAAATSTLTLSTCGRNAGSASAVSVVINHPYRGDLVIELKAPDGSTYRLKNSSVLDGADDVNTTYTVNLSSEAANGTWTLSVRDAYAGDAGYLNAWAIAV